MDVPVIHHAETNAPNGSGDRCLLREHLRCEAENEVGKHGVVVAVESIVPDAAFGVLIAEAAIAGQGQRPRDQEPAAPTINWTDPYPYIFHSASCQPGS